MFSHWAFDLKKKKKGLPSKNAKMLKMCKIAEKKTFSSDQNVIHPMDSAKGFLNFHPSLHLRRANSFFLHYLEWV